MFRNQYDTDVTVWSPEGRLLQVRSCRGGGSYYSLSITFPTVSLTHSLIYITLSLSGRIRHGIRQAGFRLRRIAQQHALRLGRLEALRIRIEQPPKENYRD